MKGRRRNVELFKRRRDEPITSSSTKLRRNDTQPPIHPKNPENATKTLVQEPSQERPPTLLDVTPNRRIRRYDNHNGKDHDGRSFSTSNRRRADANSGRNESGRLFSPESHVIPDYRVLVLNVCSYPYMQWFLCLLFVLLYIPWWYLSCEVAF